MKARQDQGATANVATVAGLVLFVLAVLVLLGWVFNLRGLQSFAPESAEIKANSAVAMLLGSVALLSRNYRVLPFLSIAVFLIGALTLSEYFWDSNLGIDEFLFRDTHYFLYPGRMSQYTSFGYMLFGSSLLPMNSRHRVLRQLSRGLGILTGALGTLAIVSHAYDTHAGNLISPQSNVSVPTAIGLLIGAIGVQYANPSEGIVRLLHADNAGGAMLRRLLPAAILLPLLLGYAVRDAQKLYSWESGFSLALVGLGVGACLITGIVLTAVGLERQDLSRRESESRFMLAAKTAPVMIWMSGTDMLRNYFSEPWLEFTGRSLESELGNGWTGGVHPDDLKQCIATYVDSFDRRVPFQMEYRLLRHDTEYRWVFDTGVPRLDGEHSFVGYIGSCVDITERKLAEETLASLSGRLIQAQESERSRIAREIHDDFQQRVAMLSIDVEHLAEFMERDSEGRGRLHEFWDRLGELGSDLHFLSHHLHSSTLDTLGLVAALRSLCAEFSEYNAINVSFVEEDVPRDIPREVALCLFRITQEALQNVKKHSHADSAEVRVERLEQRIHLSISDSGTGFDQGAGSRQTGIGIQSMEERARLVGGQFAVNSRPTEGTKIDAWVPIGDTLLSLDILHLKEGSHT
jgi:PAS domain S-box-containing protein